MKLKNYAWLVVLVFLSGAAPYVSAAGIEFSVEDVTRVKGVDNVRISPDGVTILYTVREIDVSETRYLTSLWTAEFEGGSPRLLIDKWSAIVMPCWSPDGRKLAFLSDHDGAMRIWVLLLETGEVASVHLSDEFAGPISTHPMYSGLQWSPDGRKLAFAAHDSVEDADPYLWKQWYSTEGFPEIRSRVQLWTVDVNGGTPLQLTTGDHHHGQPVWSPDGKQLAFMANRSRGRDESILWSINENYDIWLISSSGGSPTRLTENEGPDTHPVWSPDGQRIAYATVPYQGSHNDVRRLSVVEVETGEVSEVTGSSEFPWSVDLFPGGWAGPSIHFRADVGMTSQAFRIDLDKAEIEPDASTSGKHVVSSLSVSRDAKRLAFVVQGPRRPPEVWASLADGSGLRRISDSNRHITKNSLADAEIVRWEGRDGTQIEGMVVKPVGFKDSTQYPLLVLPHGGPHSVWRLGFRMQNQVYAQKGYVLFAPNIRGSAGYGQQFIDANRGDHGGGDFQDLMSGVDFLIDQGFIDPERLVITGGSYGGYMTTWAVGQTNRFKAAVAYSPVVNVHSFFGTTDIPAWVEWEYYGPPWNYPDLIRAKSPISYVQNVTTPTLLMHGRNDVRVPVSQSFEFFRALQKLGVTTELAIYPDEQHVPTRPAHQVDQLSRTLRWFEDHIESSSSRNQ